jgi:hypothetical protein
MWKKTDGLFTYMFLRSLRTLVWKETQVATTITDLSSVSLQIPRIPIPLTTVSVRIRSIYSASQNKTDTQTVTCHAQRTIVIWITADRSFAFERPKWKRDGYILLQYKFLWTKGRYREIYWQSWVANCWISSLIKALGLVRATETYQMWPAHQ